MNTMPFPTTALARAAWAACIVAADLVLPVGAGVTDIAGQPWPPLPRCRPSPICCSSWTTLAGMDSDYMPDDIGSSGTYGYRSAQCNGVAYDPNVTYSPPLRADGSSYDNASFTDAYSDGYDTTTSHGSLSGKVLLRLQWLTAQNGLDLHHGRLVNNTFAQRCFSSVGNNPGAGVFTKITVTTSSAAAEKQNYANWYSYYRKRYLLMRTAMGRAIAALDSSYRVGFSAISDTSATDGTNYFRDVKTFDSTQKNNFTPACTRSNPVPGRPCAQPCPKPGVTMPTRRQGKPMTRCNIPANATMPCCPPTATGTTTTRLNLRPLRR